MDNAIEGRLFLAGTWQSTDNKQSVTNPYTAREVARVSIADKNQLEQATVAAVNAVTDFLRLPRHARSQFCADIAEGISRRAEDLARLITRESGKPIQYARGEVSRAITTFTLAAHEALRFTGEVVPLDVAPASTGLSAVTRREPAGPVAAIAPFNFPLNLVAHKIAPALAVGCPVVLKPAPQTPLTALALAQIIQEARVPAGFISVLPMEVETAEMMVRDERFAVLSFTGSAAVGWHLKSIAGRKRVLLELGGNAPAIVHADADIQVAAAKLAHSSFAAAGQVCIKSQRLLVHKTVWAEFTDAFLAATNKLVVGDPTDTATVVGPVIDVKSVERIHAWVQEALDQGAILLAGKPGSSPQNVVSPIVLTNVPRHAKCREEEIFGPVVILDNYEDIHEAITQANDSRYGLQAAVFSMDVRIHELAARDLQFGGVILNDTPMVRVDNYPYGGIKESGLGREGVRYTMEEYTHTKTIVTRSTL